VQVITQSGDYQWEKAGLVLLSSFLIGITIACVDVAANHIPPVTLTSLRLSIASIAFCAILFFQRPKYQWHLRSASDIVIIGLLNVGLPFLLLATAVMYISSALAAVLLNTSPVITIVIAHCLLPDEKLNRIKFVGTITAVAGAAILMVSNASGLEFAHSMGWIGQTLVIVGSLSAAVGVIYTRIRLHKEDTTILAAGQVFASLVILAPLALLTEGKPDFASYPWQSWGAMFVSALSSPVAASWLFFFIIHKYSASLAGFATIAAPLFSVFIGVALLGEVITWPITIGTLLMLVGVWLLHHF
jgi:drug/metabolite transporter (DMT)-like permease